MGDTTDKGSQGAAGGESETHGVQRAEGTGPAAVPVKPRRVLPPPLTAAQRAVLTDRAYELNLAGNSYGKIAKLLSDRGVQEAMKLIGPADEPRAIPKVLVFRLVWRALQELREDIKEKVELKRIRELHRLDGIFLANWPKRGEPRHADVLLRVSERRSKLEGLDRPTEVSVSASVEPALKLGDLTDDELAAYEKLIAAVAERAAKPAETEKPDLSEEG